MSRSRLLLGAAAGVLVLLALWIFGRGRQVADRRGPGPVMMRSAEEQKAEVNVALPYYLTHTSWNSDTTPQEVLQNEIPAPAPIGFEVAVKTR